MNHTNTQKLLENMPDVYIDRWIPKDERGGSKWRAVWCIVEVPEDCPMPS